MLVGAGGNTPGRGATERHEEGRRGGVAGGDAAQNERAGGVNEIRHIVFDLGKVLLEWDPERPYRRLIPDAAARRHFLTNVCNPDWNNEQDRGRTWREAEDLLIAQHPQHEAMIRAYKRHGAQICHGWGMTEMSPLGTVSFIKPELQHLGEEERIGRFAMAGVPAPIMDIRLVGDDGGECAWDGKSVGEIQVRGPFIAGGYHDVPNDPEKFTADGWLRTGDVAAMDAHGYLRITDRTKDLIKSGGEWISSVDMENQLMAHPAVLEAAVIAVPDAKWTERPLACVVLKPGKRAAADELRAHLSAKFVKWQLPDRFEFLDAIPRTSTGKFWKVKLRERFRA